MRYLVECFEQNPTLTFIVLIICWGYFLMPPSQEIKERQLKHWGVSGYKVWWKIMSYQKPINPEQNRSLLISLVVLGLVLGSIFIVAQYLYFTFTTFPEGI